MKISFIGHAAVLVEAKGVRILSDPWWKGPCFGAQWWIHPAPWLAPLEAAAADFIYVSHGHSDHLHPSTLRSLPTTAKVIVSSALDIAEPIEKFGFEVISFAPKEVREIAPGVRVEVTPTHGSDTLMVIDDGEEICLNLNDAVHATPSEPRAAIIADLKSRYGRADYAFCGYGTASHFPNCYIVSGGDREAKIGEDRNIWGNLGLAELAREQNVEEIVVALDDRRDSMPVRALLDCKLAGLTITDYATFWERETGKVDLEALHPSWLIFSDGFVGGRPQAIVKRVFDLMSSLVLLAATFPLLCLTAILVRLDSPGPIFYRQERVGLNGVPFPLLKFRSMANDAEKDGVPRWAEVNDTRVTGVGRVIRLTRVDEIPQIINVMRGEMSFIGPRPERPFFVDRLKDLIPYYYERHRVKPGISGWAQLNYPYGASDEDAKQKFQFDLYYIKNYSLFLDLIVLVQTARVVMWPSGAGAR